MLAKTVTETCETHPPLEIFCPYCQPNLSLYAQFPQTAKRKMRQAVFSVIDDLTSIIYSCEDCCEIQATRWNGSWHIMPNQIGGNVGMLPQDYKEYLKRVFGEYELILPKL